MKTKFKKKLSTVIIVNYNNAEFLDKSVSSILEQNYSPIEIIVVDDKSTDNSIDILKKYQNKIKVIKNKKKTKQGSYNQINSYYKGFLKSNGDYIFFLDSDDYFKRTKIKLVVDQFTKTKIDLIFDLPILKFKNFFKKEKFIQKKFIFSSWPRFSPQSCISVKREFANEIFNNVKIKKFESIWFDFRIAAYSFLKKKNIFIFYRYLTYYRQLESSASKNYKLFSKNWWYRRNQAHDILSYFSKKLKKKDKLTLDKFLTKIIYFFFK